MSTEMSRLIERYEQRIAKAEADLPPRAKELLVDAMVMLKEIEKARELPPFAQAQQQYVALGREIEAYLKEKD
jgi:hypothetical protein